MPASVGRPTLICTLASSIKRLPQLFNQRAGLSPALVTMETNGRGGNCGWMEHRGRAGAVSGGNSQGGYVLGITKVASGGFIDNRQQRTQMNVQSV